MDWKELLGKRILIWQKLPDAVSLPLYEVTLLEIFEPEQSPLATEQYTLLKFERPVNQAMAGFTEFWVKDTEVELCGVLDK